MVFIMLVVDQCMNKMQILSQLREIKYNSHEVFILFNFT